MDVLLIILLLCLFFGVGTGPWWGYHHMGYGPSGLLWTVALICFIVWLVRRARV
jgi:hypothetical protein